MVSAFFCLFALAICRSSSGVSPSLRAALGSLIRPLRVAPSSDSESLRLEITVFFLNPSVSELAVHMDSGS